MIKLDHFYPKPNKLIDNERKVLDYLEGNSYIATHHPKFLADIKSYTKQMYKGKLGLKFASHIDVFHSEMKRVKGFALSHRNRQGNIRLVFSVIIRQNSARTYGDMITYALAVCRIRSLNPIPTETKTLPLILRKFHFDIAFPSAGQRLEQPISHLQYCGTMIPYMKDEGYPESQLHQMHSKLSEPRLFFWPMSLAFLLDTAFREFPDTLSARFIRTNEWRGLLHESEKLIMRPFLEKCLKVIDRQGTTDPTLSDAFYVK